MINHIHYYLCCSHSLHSIEEAIRKIVIDEEVLYKLLCALPVKKSISTSHKAKPVKIYCKINWTKTLTEVYVICEDSFNYSSPHIIKTDVFR